MPVTVSALVGADASLAALDELASTIDDNARDERLLARRVRSLRAGRARGRRWEDLLTDEPGPGTLDLLRRVLNRAAQVSGRLRRTLAQGLRGQGASIAAIASRFGVSHQRVSALLRRDDR